MGVSQSQKVAPGQFEVLFGKTLWTIHHFDLPPCNLEHEGTLVRIGNLAPLVQQAVSIHEDLGGMDLGLLGH